MKIIITFDQIKTTKLSGLDAAISLAFPRCSHVYREGLLGLPYGSIVGDGVAYDWLLKPGCYVFIPAF